MVRLTRILSYYMVSYMKLDKGEQKKYGLTQIDYKLLETLEKKGMLTSSQIALLVPVSRTTISFRLNKLCERGFCAKFKKKNLAFWILNNEIFTHNINGETSTHYRGVYELHRVMNMLATCSIQGRVYIFEPRQQTEWFIKNIHKDLYAEVCKNIQKNSIIVEALVSADIKNLLPRLDLKTRGAMFGRMTIAYELEDTILNLDRNIIIINDDVYLFDWKTITLTVVKSNIVANTYRTFFEFYKSFGKKTDFNAMLK